jgi:hypothetical protein
MPNQSRFTWNQATRRYRDGATGRFVPQQTVFRELNRVIRVSERRMALVADGYREGRMSLVEFKLAMRLEVKTLHVATAIVSNGGLRQMDSRAWGEVGARLRSEYAYLNRFGRELSSGRLARDSKRVRARARSYAANARMQFWQVTNARLLETGLTVLARRRKGAVQTEHCAGCTRASSSAFVPLSQLPAIGTMECAWFCQCFFEYKIVRADA